MTASLESAALIVVDVQNDFCPGGSLEVPDGDRVVAVLNGYAARFAAAQRPVFASRDWHPEHTRHFQEHGGLWPPHCVQGSKGAEFHPNLRLPQGSIVVSKGQRFDDDGFSAFPSTLEDGRSLAEALRAASVRRLYIGGLATDWCVKATVLDAMAAGFEVTLLLDASCGVNLQPHDAEQAIEEMVRAGATTATLAQIAEVATTP
ncbi:MAG: bifunctional nicotinamidase/pyrazinamidase [Dehalococcoidia bacterium]